MCSAPKTKRDLIYLYTPTEHGHLEFGAQWIHGDEGNPLYWEMSKLDLLDYRGEHLYGDELARMSPACF